MIRPILFVLSVLALFCLSRAFAGGGEYEAPIQLGRCNPITVPEDLIGEGWKWVKVHSRMEISKGDNEIQPFQMMYCREFTRSGGILREYVIAMEWWRPRARKPKPTGTGGH